MEIINAAKREADMADQIVSRTYEQYQYDINIANYEAMLATLPEGDWPAEILPYRDMSDHDGAFACPIDLVDDLAQYQLRDRIANLIKSERVERAKVSAILAATDAQLSGPGRDAALQAAIARREATFGN